jgi:hypothetical protein
MERGAAPAGMRSSRRLPGGFGTPLYGHYDPCARSSLNGLPPVRGRYANAVRGSCGLACAAHARRRKKARRAQSRQVMRREAAGFAGTRRIRNALRLSAHHSPHLAHVGFTRYAPLQVSRRRRTRRRKQYGRRSFARARRGTQIWRNQILRRALYRAWQRNQSPRKSRPNGPRPPPITATPIRAPLTVSPFCAPRG